MSTQERYGAQSLRSVQDSSSLLNIVSKAQAIEASSSGLSLSSLQSPSTDDEHRRRTDKTVQEEETVEKLEGGRLIDQEDHWNAEDTESIEEDFDEDEDGDEFTVMGRHGALISLIWGATALYVLLIRAKVSLMTSLIKINSLFCLFTFSKLI